jgi:hypothetical protein
MVFFDTDDLTPKTNPRLPDSVPAAPMEWRREWCWGMRGMALRGRNKSVFPNLLFPEHRVPYRGISHETVR